MEGTKEGGRRVGRQPWGHKPIIPTPRRPAISEFKASVVVFIGNSKSAGTI